MDHSNLPEIWVEEEEDGSLTIHWDDTDPRAIASGINDWTEDDWVEALEETLAALEARESKEESAE